MKLHWVRDEIARMRGQIRAQEREVRMLRRASALTASAELLLSRMRTKVDDLCQGAGGSAEVCHPEGRQLGAACRELHPSD